MHNNPPATIAVFDGVDVPGTAVIDSLLSRGAHVRALVRDSESDPARELAARGVELAQVDAGDSVSLTAALGRWTPSS